MLADCVYTHGGDSRNIGIGMLAFVLCVDSFGALDSCLLVSVQWTLSVLYIPFFPLNILFVPFRFLFRRCESAPKKTPSIDTQHTIILLIRVYAFAMVIQKALRLSHIFSTRIRLSFFPLSPFILFRLFSMYGYTSTHFYCPNAMASNGKKRALSYISGSCIYRSQMRFAMYAYIPINECELRRWEKRISKGKKTHTTHVSFYIYLVVLYTFIHKYIYKCINVCMDRGRNT